MTLQLRRALGAVKERIERHGGGWLFDPADAAEWYAGMLRVLDTPGEYEARAREARSAPLPTVEEMAGQYRQIYAELLGDTAPRAKSAAELLSAT